jgi:hypothetical protein
VGDGIGHPSWRLVLGLRQGLVMNATGSFVLRLSKDLGLSLWNAGYGLSFCRRPVLLEPRALAVRVALLARVVAGSVRGRGLAYSFRYSRSRRVCVRLTGISVAFASFMRRR